MSPEKLPVRVWNLFLRFRKTPWFRVTYLVLLGLIVAFMLPYTAGGLGCLVVFVVPLAVFLVPYYLGERSVKRFAINALPVIVIAIVLGAALATQPILGQSPPILGSSPGPFSSSTMALSNGTVEPYRANPPATFIFRVRLNTTVNGTPGDFVVSLNLSTITGFATITPSDIPMVYAPGPESFNNTSLGTWYETSVPLSDSIYTFGFSVWDRGSNWTFSNFDVGPITAPSLTFYGLFLFFTMISLILPFTFYYVILFMWWYTVRARAQRTRMLGAEAEIPKARPKPKAEEAALPTSEKASKAAAFTCTNCGADVDENDTKCPKCGAVFEE